MTPSYTGCGLTMVRMRDERSSIARQKKRACEENKCAQHDDICPLTEGKKKDWIFY